MIRLTDDWDFYLAKVDDQPAFIFVDLGLSETPSSHPMMAYLSVKMHDPRPDGLSTDEEYDQLRTIEIALEQLDSGADAIYVGRCTTDGSRDFYFYTTAEFAWEDHARQFMRDFPAYRYSIGGRHDPAWSAYHDFLYPNGRALLSIKNRRVCQVLQSHGDPLSQAREIDHYAVFQNQANRDAFIADAAAQGFSASASDAEDPCYASLFRIDTPCIPEIDDITYSLYELARQHGGSYDGWGCEALTAEG